MPQERIELSASPLPRVRSTPELLRRRARFSNALGRAFFGPVPVRSSAGNAVDESGANLPQAALSSKRFCQVRACRHVAERREIGHQIAMKSDKKRASKVGAPGGRQERLEREAAALRANLRRRKQQQEERRAREREAEGPEEQGDR